MTRETKIGLLTGLGVIVLIGMLLSNYLGNGPAGDSASLTSSWGSSFRHQVREPVTVPSAADAVVPADVDVAAAAPAKTPAVVQALVTRLPDHAEAVPAAFAAERRTSTDPVVNAPVNAVPAGPVIVPANPTNFVATNNVHTAENAAAFIPASRVVPAAATSSAPTLAINDQPLKLAAPAVAVAPVVVPTTPEVLAPIRSSGLSYSVGKGDTLTVISKKFYHSAKQSDFEKIVAANPAILKDAKTRLSIGMKLMIPDVATSSTAAVEPSHVVAAAADRSTAAAPVPTPTPGLVIVPVKTAAAMPAAKPVAVNYTVKKGDTLGKIAKLYMGSESKTAIHKIVAANHLDGPDDLEVGMVLKIPAKASTHG